MGTVEHGRSLFYFGRWYVLIFHFTTLGIDGTVWFISESGNAYVLNSDAQTMVPVQVQIPPLQHISVWDARYLLGCTQTNDLVVIRLDPTNNTQFTTNKVLGDCCKCSVGGIEWKDVWALKCDKKVQKNVHLALLIH